MKDKNHGSSSRTTLVPNFGENNEGWSSERVPRQPGTQSGSSTNVVGSRRHTVTASAWAPLYSGRALPSKWEDAERWICSPVSGSNGSKCSLPQSQQYMRRPKSKSGPILPPGTGCYSPSLIQGLDGGSVGNFVVNSPFLTGVLMPKGIGVHFTGAGGGVGVGGGRRVSDVVARLDAMPYWSELVSESSLPSSRDEKVAEAQESEAAVARVASRRDMATQMSRDDNSTAHSSPKTRTFSSPPATNSQTDHPAKLEIREVQVDNRATVVNHSSKAHGRCMFTKKGLLPDVVDSPDQNGDDEPVQASPWTLSQAASDLSKLQREEVKISAWENLQRAKAEAAIRKLEMKLEKKRSASMDKILNKLRTAQNKAEEMRSTVSVKEEHRIFKRYCNISFFSKRPRMISMNMTRCFFCRT